MYLVRSVVYDKIEDDPHAPFMGFRNKPLHILNRAVRRINVLVVRNVVSHIHLWRIIHGTDPNGINTDGSDVVEFGNYAIEIANAVAVGVFEACGVDLVDDAVLPPLALGDCHYCDRRRIVRTDCAVGECVSWTNVKSVILVACGRLAPTLIPSAAIGIVGRHVVHLSNQSSTPW